MWQHKNNQLQKTFIFEDFKEAFAFMTQVAFVAEKMNHHPEWTNVYHTVHFFLSTHDAQNTVTQKDQLLAEKIDQIYHKMKPQK